MLYETAVSYVRAHVHKKTFTGGDIILLAYTKSIDIELCIRKGRVGFGFADYENVNIQHAFPRQQIYSQLRNYSTVYATMQLFVAFMLKLFSHSVCNHCSLGMNTWFHPTLYWVCDYSSTRGFKLIHASKMGLRSLETYFDYTPWHKHN